ncbi:MAG: PIN domain nuclease [Planctomycetota bacterium]
MSAFIDTGILLRAVHHADPFYPEVRAAVRQLISTRIPIFTGLQHFAEFWNVCTRPPSQRGGFNLSIEETERRLRRIERGVRLLTDTPLTPEIWKSLVHKHAVRGVQVHDARTVALMLTHSLTELVTLNKADFIRYRSDGITPITPAELLASPSAL